MVANSSSARLQTISDVISDWETVNTVTVRNIGSDQNAVAVHHNCNSERAVTNLTHKVEEQFDVKHIHPAPCEVSDSALYFVVK